MPKVSVIMSVYNGEKYLKEAVDSILNQTFKDFEFIIVDDGSTDGTFAILKNYKDHRIKIINQSRLGIAEAKNKAVDSSSGEYIAIMDADDVSLPERLEVEVDFLEQHKDVGLVSADLYMVDENGKLILERSALNGNEYIQKRIRESFCIHHGPSMIRRDVFQMVGGYRKEFRYALDYDLFLRIAENAMLENINRPLYKYRVSFNSISLAKKPEQDAYAELARICARERKQHGKDRLKDLDKENLRILLRKLSSQIKKKNNLLDMYYYWAERFYLRDDYKNAFRYLCRSILYRPFNKENLSLFLKTCVHLMFSQEILNRVKVIILRCKCPRSA